MVYDNQYSTPLTAGNKKPPPCDGGKTFTCYEFVEIKEFFWLGFIVSCVAQDKPTYFSYYVIP